MWPWWAWGRVMEQPNVPEIGSIVKQDGQPAGLPPLPTPHPTRKCAAPDVQE
jgi:hypothetical protein